MQNGVHEQWTLTHTSWMFVSHRRIYSSRFFFLVLLQLVSRFSSSFYSIRLYVHLRYCAIVYLVSRCHRHYYLIFHLTCDGRPCNSPRFFALPSLCRVLWVYACQRTNVSYSFQTKRQKNGLLHCAGRRDEWIFRNVRAHKRHRTKSYFVHEYANGMTQTVGHNHQSIDKLQRQPPNSSALS